MSADDERAGEFLGVLTENPEGGPAPGRDSRGLGIFGAA